MYERLKRVVQQVLPAHWLRQNDAWLRRLVSMAYLGNRFQCNVCGFRMSRFIVLSNGEWLCPCCGSLPRTRRLSYLLQQGDTLTGKKVLHFSPPACLSRQLKQSEVQSYLTTDFADEFAADRQMDITDTGEPDEEYDLIICYHVLEHIEEDAEAMRELYRILRPGGQCFIQTPFKKGETYENPDIQSRADRKLHFGQVDHVRIYSVKGLKARLQEAGFIVEERKFEEAQGSRYGFKAPETILIARKGQEEYAI